MKIVRLENNTVREIIPGYAQPVEQWYGITFASQCVEAPDEVDQHWVYDPATQTFSAAAEADVGTTAAEQIAAMKEQLAETDYKIIKCSEYQLAGLELPYDIAALHTDRQALRDQINELEKA